MHINVVQFLEEFSPFLIPETAIGPQSFASKVIGNRQICVATKVLHMLMDHAHRESRWIPVSQLFIPQADPQHMLSMRFNQAQSLVNQGFSITAIGDVDAGLKLQIQVQRFDRSKDALGVCIRAPGSNGVKAEVHHLLECGFQPFLTTPCTLGINGKANALSAFPEGLTCGIGGYWVWSFG